jgi:hypothetical protein
MFSSRGGTRTRTLRSELGILSPVRLPIPPLGHMLFGMLLQTLILAQTGTVRLMGRCSFSQLEPALPQCNIVRICLCRIVEFEG